MQELLADLLPWVIVFYVADGLVLVRRGHLFLTGGWDLRPLRAGLAWLGLSPFAEAVAVQDLPFLLGEGAAGVHVFDPGRRTDPPRVEAADLTALPPEALRALECTGRVVSAAGRKLVVAPTAEEARLVHAALAALARGEAPAWPSTDLGAARALRAGQRPWRVTLQALAAVLAVLVLGAAPLAAWSRWVEVVPAGEVLLAILLVLLAMVPAGAGLLRAGGEGRLRSLGGGLSLLLPWAALHPLTHLSRPAFRRFDALTAAAALLPAPAFHALAGRELVRTRLSRASTPAALAPAWDAREARLRRLLAATGASEQEVLRPPAPAGGAAAYCPLCRGLYRPGFTRCADCDLEVIPLGRSAKARPPRRKKKRAR